MPSSARALFEEDRVVEASALRLSFRPRNMQSRRFLLSQRLILCERWAS